LISYKAPHYVDFSNLLSLHLNSGILKLIKRIHRNRQHDDVISLFLFYRNKESILKRAGSVEMKLKSLAEKVVYLQYHRRHVITLMLSVYTYRCFLGCGAV
jgi:hypothetical protein